MRLLRCLTGPLGALLLLMGSGTSAPGQDPWMNPMGPAQGMPTYYQPWPAVSPYYGLDYSRLSNENGLWQTDNELAGHGRSLGFRLEYLYIEAERPDGIIGNPNALTYKQVILPILEGDPFDLGMTGGGGAGGNQVDFIGAFMGDANGPGLRYYDAAPLELVGKPLLEGTRLTFDIDNSDGSGMSFWGYAVADDDAEFDARSLVERQGRGAQLDLLLRILSRDPIDFTIDQAEIAPIDIDDIFQNNLLNLFGIPLNDGTLVQLPDGTFIGGLTAPYDLGFSYKVEVQQYSAGMNWRTQPIVKTNYLQISPVFAVRYLNHREEFGFVGMDSGLIYDNLGPTDPIFPDVKLHSLPSGFDEDGDGIIDNAVAIEDDQQGGGGGATMSRVLGINNFATIYPVTSYVNARVHSHLIGPEVGLNYRLGGEKFRITGSTQFALLANLERIRLEGDNIFVTTRESTSLLPTPEDGRPNRFRDSDEHTHVSPLIEQSIYLEGPVLQYIPIIRRSPLFKNADFRAGYTFTWITEVARPQNSIIWKGNPSQDIFPEIKIHRTTYTMNTWSFGVTWRW